MDPKQRDLYSGLIVFNLGLLFLIISSFIVAEIVFTNAEEYQETMEFIVAASSGVIVLRIILLPLTIETYYLLWETIKTRKVEEKIVFFQEITSVVLDVVVIISLIVFLPKVDLFYAIYPVSGTVLGFIIMAIRRMLKR